MAPYDVASNIYQALTRGGSRMGTHPWVGRGRYRSPRHSMPLDSTHEGVYGVSMTSRASAWQMLLAASYDPVSFFKQGFNMRVDFVAGNIWQA